MNDKEVLHFTPERSLTIWLKRDSVNATTADLYNHANLQLDIQDSALPDSSYAVIICNHVLEHVTNFHKALLELYRVLRPNGLLICSSPVNLQYDTVHKDAYVVTKQERIEHFGQYDHLRLFCANSTSQLSEIGFGVSPVTGRMPEHDSPCDRSYQL